MKLIKNFSLLILTLLALSALIVSCNGDDETPAREFTSGVLVINEGNFNSSNGSITHYNPETNEATQDIFGQRNNGQALGDVVQSLTIAGDFAYAIVNNDNKAEVLNANTFEKVHTITAVSLPRYFSTLNGKGYLTEWVSYEDPGRVAVVNLTSHVVETTIITDYGSEHIIAANNKLFVSNNFTNTISVIDPTTNQVSAMIEVAYGPDAFVLDVENNLWVICRGTYPDYASSLHRINTLTNTVDKTIELGANFSRLTINKAKNYLYTLKGNHMYKIAITDTTLPEAAFLSIEAAVGLYGIGVDPATDEIYVADAKGFVANGTVYRYTATGTRIDEFNTGKGPNGFVFR
jgi:YVTN family beta-propeller protein